MAFRNLFFDLGIFSSYKIPVKSICVGNISVGGTGKTPHVDLIAHLLTEENKKIAILSRGYGRTTKGVLEVTPNSIATEVGDEPLFYKLKYEAQITVVVAEKRKLGVDFILSNYPETEIILLDDAFQHRAVKAGLNILITDYSHLYSNDYVLPAGNLREFRSGRNRADILIVSKCPTDLSHTKKEDIISVLDVNHSNVFFSSIHYNDLKKFAGSNQNDSTKAVLITGIGNPTPLLNRLKENFQIEHLKFSDHHTFTTAEIEQIQQKIDTFAQEDGIVITTEKDFMRLKDVERILTSKNNWYYQPIASKIDEQEKFNLLIKNYVNEI